MKKKQPNKRELMQLATRLDSVQVNEAKRSVSAALSAGAVVKRWFGDEKLVISKESVNLDRAAHGLPLLFNHDPTKPIGRVNNVRVDSDNVLRGDLDFSNNELANSVHRDVSEEFLNDVSIGYRITEHLEKDDGIEVTRFDLYEASIVTIPADINAGVNRSIDYNQNLKPKEGLTMSDQDKKAIGDDAVSAYRAAEKTRTDEINLTFSDQYRGGAFDELKTRALGDDKMSIDMVRKELLTLVGKDTAPAGGVSHVVDDEQDKLARGITEALTVKIGTNRDDKIITGIRGNEFFGMSMVEIARVCLSRAGIAPKSNSRMDIVGDALSMRVMQSTASFPGILENIAHGSMQLAYEEAEETWRTWARVGNLTDFKLAKRPNLSAFDSLPEVPETTEYGYGTFNDVNEHIQLATYGKLFEISRQALINDDLDGLARIPGAMGRAAARTVGDLAYDVLLNNAPMDQDALPIFDFSKNNDFNNLSGVIDNAAIETMLIAMATQKDPSGNATLGIFPKFLVVPTTKASAARVLMDAQYEPGTAPGNLMPNPHKGLMQVVSEHRLEADPNKHYYAIASNNVSETVEVAFLDGVDSPTLETEDPFTRDGVTYKVRIDAGARALEYRGMARTHDE